MLNTDELNEKFNNLHPSTRNQTVTKEFKPKEDTLDKKEKDLLNSGMSIGNIFALTLRKEYPHDKQE